MNRMIMTLALAAGLVVPGARAAEAAKAGAGVDARAKVRELRLLVRQDKQALKKDWLDGRREMAALKAQEAEERKAAQASNAEPVRKKAQLEIVAKNFAMTRQSVRARRGPARLALKQKLKDDQARHKILSKAR